VSEDICAAESLSRLQIYIHTLEEGWRPLLGHRFDSALGAFVGEGSGSMIIAVLGPAEALKQPESPEAPAPEAAPTPADGFLRAPLPLPLMEGESVPETLPDGAVASAGIPVEGPGESGGPVPGDPAAVAPQSAAKPLFDLEFMDQPGVPQPASSLFAGQDPDRSGAPADGGDGEKKEKKRKKKDRAAAEAAGTAPATPETEQAPRKAKKKVTQDAAPRSRAPKTNFN
jgi:hypothetical protein